MSKIYVTRPYLPSKAKYKKLVDQIFENQILTNKGPLHNQLISELNEKMGISNINLFVNGHQALEIAIKSLNLAPGGEVITTPFTFVSTTHAIINCGLKPVFCDIKETDYTIDENKIEALITKNTVAILGVHVYGNPCNVEAIEKIAKKHNLKVIYDAAHAFGVKYKNKSILDYGDVSMVSFHATKVFNTIEGGLTSTRDQEAFEIQGKLQNFGIYNYKYEYIGTNAKMNEFQAAMGLASIDDFAKIVKRRKHIINLYIRELKQCDGIKLQNYKLNNVDHNYAYFPIVVVPEKYGLNRDELSEILEENDIYPRKYFYPLTSEMECYFDLFPEFRQYEVPVAKKIAERVLTLPLYYDLKDEEVEKICSIIRSKRR